MLDRGENPVEVQARAASHVLPAAPLADPLGRGTAKFIDLLIVGAAAQFLPPIGFLAGLTYMLIADGIPSGPGLGKRILGLVVRTAGGQPCTVRASVVRNLSIAVPMTIWYVFGQAGWLLGMVGWVALLGSLAVESVLMIGNPYGLRIGDEIASTVVVSEPADPHR